MAEQLTATVAFSAAEFQDISAHHVHVEEQFQSGARCPVRAEIGEVAFAALKARMVRPDDEPHPPTMGEIIAAKLKADQADQLKPVQPSAHMSQKTIRRPADKKPNHTPRQAADDHAPVEIALPPAVAGQVYELLLEIKASPEPTEHTLPAIYTRPAPNQVAAKLPTPDITQSASTTYINTTEAHAQTDTVVTPTIMVPRVTEIEERLTQLTNIAVTPTPELPMTLPPQAVSPVAFEAVAQPRPVEIPEIEANEVAAEPLDIEAAPDSYDVEPPTVFEATLRGAWSVQDLAGIFLKEAMQPVTQAETDNQVQLDELSEDPAPLPIISVVTETDIRPESSNSSIIESAEPEQEMVADMVIIEHYPLPDIEAIAPVEQSLLATEANIVMLEQLGKNQVLADHDNEMMARRQVQVEEPASQLSIDHLNRLGTHEYRLSTPVALSSFMQRIRIAVRRHSLLGKFALSTA